MPDAAHRFSGAIGAADLNLQPSPAGKFYQFQTIFLESDPICVAFTQQQL